LDFAFTTPCKRPSTTPPYLLKTSLRKNKRGCLKSESVESLGLFSSIPLPKRVLRMAPRRDAIHGSLCNVSIPLVINPRFPLP
jgi:hypothetical protein